MRKLLVFLFLIPSIVFSGSSRDFDGTNDDMAAIGSSATALDITGTGLALTAWVRTAIAGQSGGSRIQTKRTTAGGNDVYCLFLLSNDIAFRINGVRLDTTGNQVPSNTWVHVVGTYNGARKKVYINGIEQADAAFTDNVDSSNRDLWIGARDGEETARRWSGQLFDVRVYNVGLTPVEVRIAMRCINQPVAGLVGQWLLMESGTNPTMVDISGIGNDMTNNGTTESDEGPPTRWCQEPS